MGGGGGGQMQSTTVTSNIPDYARPYVENMLGAAEQQIFLPGQGDTYGGFRAYTPYSTDPTKYVAAPSTGQTKAYGELLGMDTPGQFNTGTGLASLAGTAQLGLTENAGAYGAAGAGYGSQAAGLAPQAFLAGSDYDRKVTTPSEFSKYMSPYVDQIIAPQLAKAQTDYEMASNQANLASARQGTYGGARNALQQMEREKGLNINKSNIMGQGLQSAYDRALQSIQFGAGLGLQGVESGYRGLGMGMQGAGLGLQGVQTQQAGLAGAANTGNILANIGTGQQQADLGRINAMDALGGAQQAYQQNIINQSVQDYATGQQYPYMQLGMMSSLLRGLPIQNMTTQQYLAQPSILQQGAGLLGAYGAYKGAFKEGGTVKKYDVGGSVERKIDKFAEVDPSGKGLAGLMKQTKSPELKRMISAKMMENRPVRMAEGGELPRRDPDSFRRRLESMSGIYSDLGVAAPGQFSPKQQKLMELLESRDAKAGATSEEDARLRKAMAFLEFGSNPFGPLRGAIEGGKSYLAGEAAARSGLRQDELARAQAMAGLEGQQLGAAQGMIGAAQNAMLKENELSSLERRHQERMNTQRDIANARNAATMGAARISAASRGQSAAKPTTYDKQYMRVLDDLLSKGAKDTPETRLFASNEALRAMNQVPQARINAQEYSAAMKRLNENGKLLDSLERMGRDTSELRNLIDLDKALVSEYKSQSSPVGGNNPAMTGQPRRASMADMIPGPDRMQDRSSGQTAYLWPDGNYYTEPPSDDWKDRLKGIR